MAHDTFRLLVLRVLLFLVLLVLRVLLELRWPSIIM
jgi:hypothetical protein